MKQLSIFYQEKGNYWFYNHVRRHSPDYDFFSIDLPGFGFNANYETGLYTYKNSTKKNLLNQIQIKSQYSKSIIR
jgi:hypothetical protein